jgi:predicted MFS family arabinose efflux permease
MDMSVESPAGTRRVSAALAPVLVLTTMVASVVSSLGAPLIPTIADNFHVSLSEAQWSLTVGLLSGAVSAPVMGRLGDGPRRRTVIIGGVVAVLAGCVLAALAPSLLVLVIGRALQGVGLGLVPLTMAIARDELRREKVAPMIAMLSVSAAAGVGAGYPISGLIADSAGLSGAYWFGAAICAVTLACLVLVVPAKTGGEAASFDALGAVLLTAVLVAILLAVAEGPSWGWGSAAVLGLLAGGIVLLAVWSWHQLRTPSPLVELRLLRHPGVLAGDASAAVLGIAMYMALTGVTEFAQLPRSGGYGFSASVVVAGLILIPLSVFMLAGSRLLPALLRHLEIRTLLTAGCVLVAAGSAFFALWHGGLWTAFVMMGLLGLGLGITFAAIPGLIVRAVPRTETGSAMGFYQVVRYAGFSLGSAIAASILGGHESRVTGLPTASGYVTIFWVATVICLAAGALVWVLAGRKGSEPPAAGPGDEELRLLEQTDGEDLAVDTHDGRRRIS